MNRSGQRTRSRSAPASQQLSESSSTFWSKVRRRAEPPVSPEGHHQGSPDVPQDSRPSQRRIRVPPFGSPLHLGRLFPESLSLIPTSFSSHLPPIPLFP